MNLFKFVTIKNYFSAFMLFARIYNTLKRKKIKNMVIFLSSKMALNFSFTIDVNFEFLFLSLFLLEKKCFDF